MNTVTLKMKDQLTNEEVFRTIDIKNAMSQGEYTWELKSEREIKKNLEKWIMERGNDQHATILSLESWVINK